MLPSPPPPLLRALPRSRHYEEEESPVLLQLVNGVTALSPTYQPLQLLVVPAPSLPRVLLRSYEEEEAAVLLQLMRGVAILPPTAQPLP